MIVTKLLYYSQLGFELLFSRFILYNFTATILFT